MVQNDYIHPEHQKQLRELHKGGLTCTPRKWLPSQQVPPLPYVPDKYGSELTEGDKVEYDGEIHWVDSVDVKAETVDIGLDEPVAATECVGRVRNMDELIEDKILPASLLKNTGHYREVRDRLYYDSSRCRAGHRDYRFSYSGRKLLKASVREAQNKQWRESRARRKDAVAPRRGQGRGPRDGSGEMVFRHSARSSSKRVAAVIKTCPCNSGLERDWCDKCDLPGSGKSRRYFSVAAPLYGGTSDDSHKELTGMSRDDFAKYLEACMHPAPPDVKAELLGARRMLHGRPVGSMEREHVCPKSRYLRSVRGVIGFAADGKTPNDATKGAYRFCEFQYMYWRDNAQKGRGFSGDLPRLYDERLLCCMSTRSLALYKVDRLDPGVKFFKIDTIVKKLEAWGEARAKELGSDVFVPAGAKAGWLAEARVGMAEDDREIRAWRRARGEAVDDEDEEEAAVDERDREAAARERAARCVEIKAERRAADRAARDKEAREAQPRGRAFRQALRELSPAAPTRRRRRLPVDAPVSAFYWQWRCHVPATVVEVRGDGDVDVKFYDGERCVVPADLVRSPEPDVQYRQGEVVEAFFARDRCFYRATVTRCRDDLYEVAFDHTSGGAVLPSQLLRKPPPRRRPAPPPPRPRPPPPRDIPPPPRPPPRRSQRKAEPPPRPKRRKRGGK